MKNKEVKESTTHPENNRYVIFHDTTSDEKFLTLSTIETSDTDTWNDGEEYPLYKVEISSASHPFYTGKETVIDTAGRVEKFKARFAKAQEAKKPQENMNSDQEGPREVLEEEKRVLEKADTPSGKINADLKTKATQNDEN